MTSIANLAPRPAGGAYIKSRKHQAAATSALIKGGALAAMATLAMPAALAQTEPQALPAVTIQGTAERLIQAPVKSASDKFTTPLLDTPKSVTVIPADVISQTGAVSLTDALRTVPGITIGAGEGGNPVGDNLFIRGYNAQTDTYIDGIRDSGSQSREIFDLEQIEVVKGPNSAYGGRSSAGGGINLISKAPKNEDFVNATLGLGSAQYRRATLDVNQVVDENVAVRLNLMGHGNHVAGRDFVHGDRWGVAPSVTFGMRAPTKVTLSYYHMESSELPDTGLPFNNPLTSGANLSKNGDGTPVSVPRGTFYGLVNRDFRDTSSDIGTIDVSHTFSDHLKLRNVTRYGKSSNDYVWTQPDDSKGNLVNYGTVWRRANARTADTDTLANATSLSGDLTTAGVKHSYTVGVELNREETNRSSYLFTPGTNNLLTNGSTCPTAGAATGYNCTTLVGPDANDPWVYSRSVSPALSNIVTNTRSVYGFDTLEFSPRWLLNLGLRWDGYRSALNTPQYTIGTTTTKAVSAATDANFLSYQAGLVYKPSTNSSVYVSYGTSSTPPGNDAGDGLDALSTAVQELKPQESKSFELGTKWEVLPGGRLSLSAAVFQSTMSNARVTAPDGTTQNVGEKKVKGVELGFSGGLTRDWQVFGGYTFLDAVVENNGFVSQGVAPNVVYVASPLNGNRFPTTPKNSATLWSTYNFLGDFTVGGGLNYVDKVYATLNNNKFAPAYTRFDAMASYAVNKRMTLQLNVQNVGNKLYYDKVSSPHYAGVAPGRSATLTANVKF